MSRAALASSLLVMSLIYTAPELVFAEQPSCEPAAEVSVLRDRLAMLARGFNLTGWLDGAEMRRPDVSLLADLRARGFTHVRLPAAPERLLAEFSTPEQVAQTLYELDSTIKLLLGLDFAVTLDLHPGATLGRLESTEPERSFVLIDKLWRVLAERYRGQDPERLFFEVLNEPGFSPVLWAEKGPRLVDTIRGQAPDHTIIYPLSGYQRVDELAATTPLAQPNIVYAVHFYDPMIFTHQGLDWVPDDPLRYLGGVPFPTGPADPRILKLVRSLREQGHKRSASLLEAALDKPWDEERIAQAMHEAARWAAQHNVPVVLNEFGVLARKAEPLDRLRWLRAVRVSAEADCIGWAMWDYAGGFGFVNRIGDLEIADEAVLAVLLGNAPAALRRANAAAP